jgi:hypothetical protein
VKKISLKRPKVDQQSNDEFEKASSCGGSGCQEGMKLGSFFDLISDHSGNY